MGARFVIDTNVVLDFLTGKLPQSGVQWMQHLVRRQDHSLSVITQIELLGHPSVADPEHEVAVFVNESDVLALSDSVVRATILLRKTHKRKLPDAIIAATASVYGLTVVTRNVADFAHIAGLRVLNPHDVAALPTL